MSSEQIEGVRAIDSASGRSNVHLRQHNFSAILTLLHDEGPLARSVLTARTGLNRSTISALVKELVDLGFVVEEPGQPASGAGRPSLVVQPTTTIVGLSALIEIDAISVAAFGLSGTRIRQLRHELPDAPAARTAVALIIEMIEQLRADLDVETVVCGLGVAVPGQVADQEGIVTESFPLHWANVDLAGALSSRLRMPVFVDNDARIALRTWYQHGPTREARNVVYLDGQSSVISGAIIVDGELLRGNSGLAGALGLIRLQTEKVWSLHEHPGTLDALVQREVLVESFGRERMSDVELSAALRGKLSSRSERVASDQSRWLGSALATIINIFNPEHIVLDGFLAPLFETHREVVLKRCRAESVARAFEAVTIESRNSSEANELLGAAELPLRQLIASPLDVSQYRRASLVALN